MLKIIFLKFPKYVDSCCLLIHIINQQLQVEKEDLSRCLEGLGIAHWIVFNQNGGFWSILNSNLHTYMTLYQITKMHWSEFYFPIDISWLSPNVNIPWLFPAKKTNINIFLNFPDFQSQWESCSRDISLTCCWVSHFKHLISCILYLFIVWPSFSSWQRRQMYSFPQQGDCKHQYYHWNWVMKWF